MNNKKLEKAIQLRNDKHYKEARILFLELLNANEKDALINYNYAWLLDNIGNEKEAIFFYETALNNGLRKEFRKDCFLGLGSTYRMLNDFKKSLNIFEQALLEFPNEEDLLVFKSMTLIENKETENAYFLLLRTILDLNLSADVKQYSNAIENFIKTKVK